MRNKITLFQNPRALNYKAAEEFVWLAKQAIWERGFFTVALSGGETPRKFYETLTSRYFRSRIDWKYVYFFFGDERCVSPQNRLSNYRMGKETLFSKVSIPKKNIFRMKGESQPVEVAREYEKQIKKHFATPPAPLSLRGESKNSPLKIMGVKRGYELPSFDLVLLGLGVDGHVASLFPKSKALEEKKRLVVSVYNKGITPPHRITLTLPVINGAKNIFFLVTGKEKGEILKKVLIKGSKYPAQLVRPKTGRLIWFVDKKACGGI